MSSRKGGSGGGGLASKDPSQKTLQETFSGLSQKKPPSGNVVKKEKRAISDVSGNENAGVISKRLSSESNRSAIDDAVATVATPPASQCLSQVSAFGSQASSSTGLKKRKTIMDTMYQQMEFKTICVALIDTPFFQRLRRLKQLGTTDYVFPSATHTRFQHSLGVSFRGAEVVQNLMKEQRDLGLTEKDVICVSLAGLAHDMGHGPFSHQFEIFLKKVISQMEDGPKKEALKVWTHEDMSCAMIERAFKVGNIDYTLPAYGGLDERDMIFIKELIRGKEDAPVGNEEGRKHKMREGRDADKSFLYDIINNVDSGFDVDRLDYLQRDQECTLGDKFNSFERLTMNGRVCKVSGNQDWHVDTHDNCRRSICYPEKSAGEALKVYETRFNMHLKVYQHKRVMAMDEMIADILLLANDAVTVRVDDFDTGHHRRCSIAECALDCDAFVNLNDTIIDLIKNSDPDGLPPSKAESLRKAQNLLARLERRELYVNVGATKVDRHGEHKDLWEKETKGEDIAKDIIQQYNDMIENLPPSNSESLVPDSEDEDNDENVSLSQITRTKRSNSRDSSKSQHQPLPPDSICVLKWHIHYGSKDRNPVDDMFFYYKDDDLKEGWQSGMVDAHKVDSCKYHGIPGKFESCEIRVLCKDPAHASAAKIAARHYFQSRNCSSPLGMSSQDRSEFHHFSQAMSQDLD